jgi:hypothetical protein
MDMVSWSLYFFSDMYVLELTLQAIKAKMGEAGFTPLSQLSPLTHRCRVRVRISRMWESFDPNNETVFGLDSLLIDDEVTAHA